MGVRKGCAHARLPQVSAFGMVAVVLTPSLRPSPCHSPAEGQRGVVCPCESINNSFDASHRPKGEKSEENKQRNSGSAAYLKNLTTVATQYVR